MKVTLNRIHHDGPTPVGVLQSIRRLDGHSRHARPIGAASSAAALARGGRTIEAVRTIRDAEDVTLTEARERVREIQRQAGGRANQAR